MFYKNKFSKKQTIRMKNLYLSGLTTTEIGEIMKCTRKTVRAYLIKDRVFKHKTNFSQEQKTHVVNKYNNGIPLKRMAKEMGACENYIRSILKHNKIYKPYERVWTKEQKHEAIERYKKGETISKIAKSFGLSCGTVTYQLVKHGKWKYKGTRKYNFDQTFFKTIDTQEKAYWLGFIAADGNVYGYNLHIGIKASDGKHLEKFKKDIKAENPVKYVEYISKGKKLYLARIDLYGLETINCLFNLGIIENKTTKLHWSITEHIPSELVPHFLRGYFDGDGSWAGTKRVRFSMPSASSFFLLGMQKYLAKMCNLNITKIYKRGKLGILDYAGKKQLKRIAEFLYKDANVFLERKKDKIYSFIQNP